MIRYHLYFISPPFLRRERPRPPPPLQTLVEVFRRDSKKLPIGDPEIDWEETIYVNMIIHHFDYHLTLAVCTRTSPRELQVLKRHTEVRGGAGVVGISASGCYGYLGCMGMMQVVVLCEGQEKAFLMMKDKVVDEL